MAMSGNRIRDWTVVAGFFVFLTTPLVVHVFTPDVEISRTEKRQMAVTPAAPTSLSDWFSLPHRTDAYLTDHFGLRQPMVRAFTLLKYSIGESASEKVLIGRDGWLYLTNENAVEQYRGLDVYSEAELDAWVSGLRSLARAVQHCGARFVFIVAPNKHTIYPEHLPDWVLRVNNTTRLDQLYRRLAELPEIRHIDLRPRIIAAKREEQMYTRLDTHWSSLASFLAYDATMRAAVDAGIDVDLLASSDLRRVRDTREGDLAGLLGLEGTLIESTTWLEIADPPEFLNRGHFIHYPSGEHAGVEVVDTGRPDHPTIMIIGDSFGLRTTPFFEASADRFIRAHHRFGEFDFRLIEKHRPDLVVFEIAERLLARPLARTMGLEDDLGADSDSCSLEPAGANADPAHITE